MSTCASTELPRNHPDERRRTLTDAVAHEERPLLVETAARVTHLHQDLGGGGVTHSVSVRIAAEHAATVATALLGPSACGAVCEVPIEGETLRVAWYDGDVLAVRWPTSIAAAHGDLSSTGTAQTRAVWSEVAYSLCPNLRPPAAGESLSAALNRPRP